jgi:hypothetical protein
MRPVPGHEEIEALRDAAHGGKFELGAAFAQIADDAIEPGAPTIEHDGGKDHGIAARLQPPFAQVQHVQPR